MSTTAASLGPHDRRLRVFLCHASGDKPAVRDLYYRLKTDGFAPWLDEEDLLPGQYWQEEIPAAVRACDIVLVCLSQKSVSKEGYLQKEIREALSVAEEKPEGTIFIIPARLEPVDVPKRLGQWQWANLFQKDGYPRLVRALNVRASDIGVTMTAPMNAVTSAAPVAQVAPKPAPVPVIVEHQKPAAKQAETPLEPPPVTKQVPVAVSKGHGFSWNQKKYWYLAAVSIVLAAVAVLIVLQHNAHQAEEERHNEEARRVLDALGTPTPAPSPVSINPLPFPISPHKGESPRETASLSAAAMYQEGDKHYYAKDYQQASQWYEKAAAAGNSDAMNSLGILYEFGLGVTQDSRQARQWYEKAAAAGDSSAMVNLGDLYKNGKGVSQDYRQARQWYKKASAAGDPHAKQRLQELPK